MDTLCEKKSYSRWYFSTMQNELKKEDETLAAGREPEGEGAKHSKDKKSMENPLLKFE